MKKSVNLMQKLCPASVTYQIRYAEPVLKLEGAMTTAKNLPDKLTLIYPSANGHALSTSDCALPQDTQLYVGGSPVPSAQWSYCSDRFCSSNCTMRVAILNFPRMRRRAMA